MPVPVEETAAGWNKMEVDDLTRANLPFSVSRISSFTRGRGFFPSVEKTGPVLEQYQR